MTQSRDNKSKPVAAPINDFDCFTGTREELLVDPAQTSFPDMPVELIERIIRDDSGVVSLEIMAQLSRTNKSIHAFFQPGLDHAKQAKIQAKELLEYVLFPNTLNVTKIIMLAQTRPQLFFIKATAEDQTKDLKGNRRTIEDWSPYQAIFGTNDNDLLAEIKPHLDAYLNTLSNGQRMADAQINEKFPDGLNFPPGTFNFNPLADAINNDKQLKETGNPSPATFDLLMEFQQAFTPGTVITGHHFNMNELINADRSYDQHYDARNLEQLRFFSKHVIGFLQRLKTGPYQLADITGLKNLVVVQHKKSLNRDFGVINVSQIVPLDSDPDCRLGEHYVIDSYGGAWCNEVQLLNMGGNGMNVRAVKSLCERKIGCLLRLRPSADYSIGQRVGQSRD